MRMKIETVKLCGQYDLFYRRVKAILEKKIAINVFFSNGTFIQTFINRQSRRHFRQNTEESKQF